MSSISGDEARRAIDAVNAPKFTSRIPYVRSVGISCLPSDAQASWRLKNEYCPEAYTLFPDKFVPNVSELAVANRRATPRIITTTLTEKIKLVQDGGSYKVPEQTQTVSVLSRLQAPTLEDIDIRTTGPIGFVVEATNVTSQANNQYDVTIRFSDPSPITELRATELETNGLPVQLTVGAGRYTSEPQVYNAEVELVS